MIDTMPQLEVEYIRVLNRKIINKLKESSWFATEQDLYNVLKYEPKLYSSPSHTFVSDVSIHNGRRIT